MLQGGGTKSSDQCQVCSAIASEEDHLDSRYFDLVRMQYSMYHKRFRTEVVKSALNAYVKMVEKDEAGEEPRYNWRTQCGWAGWE